ncbi:unnamed protein product [Oppiella nova]|uniref:MD-2-related lipid-recognition domain-containing protein n=1 Tax=Oppiella nova TaxID=334625 RepID=A0A7R9M6U5_9ACAR|nr:unnamed protein product [Oppiella nova]CAG2171873.1 unnamed protein product [Oppiella nova]
MKTSIVLLLSLISQYSDVSCVEFKDCGSVDGKVTSIVVQDCGVSDDYCPLHIGKTASIDMKFTANVDSDKATVILTGIIPDIGAIEYLTEDGCNGKYNLKCPIKKGNQYEMKFEMQAPPVPADMTLSILVKLVDSNGKNMICQQFPAHVIP